MPTTYTFTLRAGVTLQDAVVYPDGDRYDVDQALTAGGGSIVTTDPVLADELKALRVGSLALLDVNGVSDPADTPPDPEYVVRTVNDDYVDGDAVTWDEPTQSWIPGTAGGTPNATLFIRPGGAGVVGDGVASDGAAVQAVNATIPRGTPATGCTVRIRAALYKVAGNLIKWEVENTVIDPEGGTEFRCPDATVGQRILHLAQWNQTLKARLKVTGSGSLGEGICIAVGPTTTTRYPTTVGADDSGVHAITLNDPRCSNAEVGVEFGKGANGNTGDCVLNQGRIVNCDVGIRNKSFVSTARGTWIQGCNYGLHSTTDNVDARFDLDSVTIADFNTAAVFLERGGGHTFRNLWVEQASDRAATKFFILGASGNVETVDTRFLGATEIHLDSTTPETYVFDLVNHDGLYVESLNISAHTGAFPATAFVHVGANCRGKNNFIEVIRLKRGSLANIPADWTYSKLLHNESTKGGTVVIRSIPAMPGARISSLVGPITPLPGVDYTVSQITHRDNGDTIDVTSVFCVDRRGHIAGLAGDLTTLLATLAAGSAVAYDTTFAARVSSGAAAVTVQPYEQTVTLTGAGQTATLPAASKLAGQRKTVYATNAAPNATIAAATGDTIRGSASISTQYATRTYESDGASTWFLVAST